MNNGRVVEERDGSVYVISEREYQEARKEGREIEARLGHPRGDVSSSDRCIIRPMADVPDRPLPPQPKFRAFPKALIDVPKAALVEAEAKRAKRPRRKKAA